MKRVTLTKLLLLATICATPSCGRVSAPPENGTVSTATSLSTSSPSSTESTDTTQSGESETDKSPSLPSSPPASYQKPTEAVLLDDVYANYGAMKSLRIKSRLEETGLLEHLNRTGSCEIVMKKPGCYRIEWEMAREGGDPTRGCIWNDGNGMKTAFDGVTDEVPEELQSEKAAFPLLGLSALGTTTTIPPLFFSEWAIPNSKPAFEKVQSKGTDSVDGVECMVIQFPIPYPQSDQFITRTLWIDPKTNLIRKRHDVLPSPQDAVIQKELERIEKQLDRMAEVQNTKNSADFEKQRQDFRKKMKDLQEKPQAVIVETCVHIDVKGYSVDSSEHYRLCSGPVLTCLIRSLYGVGSIATAC